MTRPGAERVLILAPLGRDASVAADMLQEAGLSSAVCRDLAMLVQELADGVGVVVLAEEAVRTADIRELSRWIAAQPPWSDLPFVVLTTHGGGLERNPLAARLGQVLGNTTLIERPFHPTTFISVVQTALRGRLRQYQAQAHLAALEESEANSRRFSAEVRQLNETLEARVEERSSELAATNRQLVAQFAEREKVEDMLRRMQRLEAVGQLTSGIAHDFNNLLTVVLGNMAFVEKQFSASGIDGKLQQRLGHIRVAAERGAKLTAQLLAFSRRQKLEPRPVDLNETLANIDDLLASTLGAGVQINTVRKPGLQPALVDPSQIEVVVLNLAINARDAMPLGGTLTLETANVTLAAPEAPEEPEAGEYVMIAVSDTGSGMTKDVRAKAFEPFFTTKGAGRGSGLGLSQVLGFAKQSGGGVRIDTRVGEGTSIKVYLPRATDVVAAGMIPAVQAAASTKKVALVLLVDDDKAVRVVTADLIRELGHVVLEVGSGGAALEALERNPNVELAVIDFAMPGMNGFELACQARAKRPELPILFVTGYADTSVLNEVGEEYIVRKPFVGDEFADKIRSALGAGGRRSFANVVQLRG